ncbi:facilitated trehalose transporter Tret1-like isoform X4 [Diorhabda carinulata]|uniref:facilitated trehalose transporter Tret1-like isoform X4 n=1 Tax=Diorhabda carinulata TaxID=1163345 RepID=UPI0025A06DE2|nr:facilitated trehalose transporter Tret1-like isoform X4 [Diorhabda carinulata]
MSENKVSERCDSEEDLTIGDATEAEKKQKPDTLFLYFVVLSGIILMLVNSATNVWTSPAIIKLHSNDTNENILGRDITTLETSLLLGIPGVVSIIGACFLPKLADFMGRRRSLQAMGLGTFLSIVGLAFSNNIYSIIGFMCLVQIFCAGVWGILPLYLTEICDDHNRAKYGCLMTVFSPIGQLYGLIIGPMFNYRIFTLLIGIPLIPFSLLFLFAPESPAYSLSKGRYDECLETLKKLRSNKTDIEIEHDFNNLKKSILKLDAKKQFSLMMLINSKECRIGLFLALLPILLQIFCGIQVITPLLGPIFNDSGSNISGNNIAIIVGTVKLITFIFTTFVIENTGRKPMLIISAFGAGISATCLGVLFYLKDIKSPLIDKFQWAPVVFVCIYFVSYSIGLGPVPMAIMSELFTSDVRATAIAVISTSNRLLMASYTALYPILAETIGTHWCMWMFGVSCFLGSFLIFKLLPDFRGKSIVEIQIILKNY